MLHLLQQRANATLMCGTVCPKRNMWEKLCGWEASKPIQTQHRRLGYASEAARKGKFQWIFFLPFMLRASIFVCQFTQIDASPLIADCDGIFADSRGNSVENLKFDISSKEVESFSRKWRLNKLSKASSRQLCAAQWKREKKSPDRNYWGGKKRNHKKITTMDIW